MMKKLVIFSFIFLLLTSFVIAVNGLEEGVEGVKGTAEDIQSFTEKERWEYLSSEWKEILLKSNSISTIDSFFRKIDFVFFLFTGEHYDLSLTLFFSVLLFIFFFVIFGRIFANFSTFSTWVSYVIAFALAVALAHLRVYDFLSLLIFKVLFYREGVWSWVFFGIMLLFYFILLVYLKTLIWIIGRQLKRSREEREKWDAMFEREVFRTKMKGMERAFDEIGGALRR